MGENDYEAKNGKPWKNNEKEENTCRNNGRVVKYKVLFK